MAADHRLAALVYRTRGLYMFAALALSIAVKHRSGGATTPVLFFAGASLVAAAQLFRWWAAGFLLGRQAVAAPEAESLCTSGPYARVRHPLYLANLLIGLGLCVAIDERYAYALFLASFAAVCSVAIPHEERFLEARFGEAYRRYKARVPMLVPSPRAYEGGDRVEPDRRAGVLGEPHVPVILALLLWAICRLFVV